MTHSKPRWTYWRLGIGHSTLELHEDTTGGVGIELELLDGGGFSKTHAVWRLSASGAILRWEVAAEA